MLRAAILPKAFTSFVWNRQMPKIPVTSKRARTFLNAQPLVPNSVKIEAGLLDQRQDLHLITFIRCMRLLKDWG